VKTTIWATALFAVLAPLTPAAAQAVGASADRSALAHGNPAAEAFVADNITRGLAILNNAGLSGQQRSDQFEALLLRMTDTQRVAVFTLGQYATSAPQADQIAFATAFQNYSVAVYQSYLSRFSGQTLMVTGSIQRAPGDFIVTTKMMDPNDHSGQPPLEVDFRMRTDAARPEVTDLNVMGVWLALSERDDFVSYLSAHGGSVPNLTAHVLQVTAQVRQPPAR
jgi:phospholipid transport system substrate-binding protein